MVFPMTLATLFQTSSALGAGAPDMPHIKWLLVNSLVNRLEGGQEQLL